MAKKIENVIENCTECRFCKEYEEMDGNTDYVIICTHFKEISGQHKPTQPFLIERSYSKIKSKIIPIPERCPLENYDE